MTQTAIESSAVQEPFQALKYFWREKEIEPKDLFDPGDLLVFGRSVFLVGGISNLTPKSLRGREKPFSQETTFCEVIDLTEGSTLRRDALLTGERTPLNEGSHTIREQDKLWLAIEEGEGKTPTLVRIDKDDPVAFVVPVDWNSIRQYSFEEIGGDSLREATLKTLEAEAELKADPYIKTQSETLLLMGGSMIAYASSLLGAPVIRDVLNALNPLFEKITPSDVITTETGVFIAAFALLMGKYLTSNEKESNTTDKLGIEIVPALADSIHNTTGIPISTNKLAKIINLPIEEPENKDDQ